jgi:hypothetical protein
MMGMHDYDLWDAELHLPWPPAAVTSVNTNSVTNSRRATEVSSTWDPSKRRRVSHRKHRENLGSARQDYGSAQSTSGDFVEPLYYEYAINSTVALLQMFADRGSPVKYVNLDYDELQAVARDSRSLRSGLTNGQLVATSINRIVKGVKLAFPEVSIVFWDDMLDPWYGARFRQKFAIMDAIVSCA